MRSDHMTVEICSQALLNTQITNAELPPFKEIKLKERFKGMSHVVILLEEPKELPIVWCLLE